MAGLAKSSGLITATAAQAIASGKCILSGVVVISDNTNVATVTVYDNASAASGTVLAKVTATSTTGANSIAFVTPIQAQDGLTVAVTGTGSSGIVYYGA